MTRCITFLIIMVIASQVFSEKNLLVICHDKFSTVAQEYITWKQQSGYIVKVGYVPAIGTTAGQIHMYIKNQRLSDPSLYYVQIIGDFEHIPGKWYTQGDANYYPDGGFSDMLYGCLGEGTMNSYRGSNDFPVLAVGRFSGQTIDNVQTQINRSIYYERDLKDNFWINRALIFSGDDDDFDPMEKSNTVILRTSGFKRIDDLNDQYNEIGCFHIPNDVPYGMKLFNEGCLLYSEHDHGLPDCEALWNVGRIPDAKNDDRLPIAFLWSCYCGLYRGWNEGSTFKKTCIAEAMVSSKNSLSGKSIGAVAVYASYTSAILEYSKGFSDNMLKSFVKPDLSTMGEVLLEGGKLAYAGSYNGGQYEFPSFHLFGDITLKIANKRSLPANNNLIVDEITHKAFYCAYENMQYVDNYSYFATQNIETMEGKVIELEGRMNNSGTSRFGANVNFVAGKSVLLRPGFGILEGATSSIRISSVRPVSKHWQDPITEDSIDLLDGKEPSGNLLSCYPNPCNPGTVVSFTVPKMNKNGYSVPVKIMIVSMRGTIISKVLERPVEPGKHSIFWDGRDNHGRLQASGTFICQVRIGKYIVNKKIIIVH